MKIDVKNLISTENVKKKVAEELEEQLTSSIKWSLGSTVEEETKKFIKEEIAPEIIKELKKNKNKIVEQFQKDITKIVAGLGEAMIAKAIVNMGSSWKLEKVVKDLFD